MVKNQFLNEWLDKLNNELVLKKIIVKINTHTRIDSLVVDKPPFHIEKSNFIYTLTYHNNDFSTPVPEDNTEITLDTTTSIGLESNYAFKRDILNITLHNFKEKFLKEMYEKSKVYKVGEKLFVFLDKDDEIKVITLNHDFNHNYVEDDFFKIVNLNFLATHSGSFGFKNLINGTSIETAYNVSPVVLENTPLPTNLDLCEEQNKNRVFVKRYDTYYGSFTIENTDNSFLRCEVSGYLLTRLRNNFNEREASRDHNYITNHILSTQYSTCSSCGNLHHVGVKVNSETAYICKGCFGDINKYGLDKDAFLKNKYKIHDYYFKQQLYFLDTPKDEDKKLFLGVELEVDTDYISEDNDDGNPCGCEEDGCDECETYYNRENNGSINHKHYANIVLHKLNGKSEGKVFAKYDGSLESGFEIISQPATLNAHLDNTIINWGGGMKVLKDIGYTSHDKGTCGIHVHINRDFFGDTKSSQNYNGAKIVYLLEKYWDKFVLFTRRRVAHLERWARKENAKGDYDNNMSKTSRVLTHAFQKNYYDNQNKYVALNTLHNATFELRIFRGTLNENTFKATLQFVDNLARLVKKTTLSKLTTLSFDDIINFKKYPELTTYWDTRKGGASVGDNG